MRRAAFFDKDGTLVRNVPFNVDPERIEFMPGALDACVTFSRAGYGIIIVSNQPGIGFGRFAAAELRPVETKVRRMLADRGVVLRAFYFCPHAPDDACTCRKPLPGMLLRAAREHDIDLGRSWMIGDILDDVEAGNAAGCRTVLVDSGHETEWREGYLRVPHVRVPTLEAIRTWKTIEALGGRDGIGRH